jgi:iron-sulfur cluster assembly protein
MTRHKKDIIELTEAAAERIKYLLEQRHKQKDKKTAVGIRIGVKSGGCSGHAYTFEYAEEVHKFDEVVEDKGVKVIIDPKAIMYLVGTKLDYIEEKMKSGFVFINPNEKARCGCGESFSV